MLGHFLAVASAVAISLWSTVLAQYHEFRGVPATVAIEESRGPVVPLATPQTPTPLETLVEEIVRHASSTPAISATSTEAVPLSPPPTPTPTPAPVPFTPLPVPVPPPLPSTPATTTPTIPTPPVVEPIDERLSDEALMRGAIVNIICLPGGGLKGSSGSGIVIDSRGIILTVAHVGQNFLLRDYPEDNAGSCYIRTGSPAKNAYSAEPIYISPSWIEENDDTFLTSKPKGTGEHDFALLAITGTLTSTPLPSRFTYVPLANAGTDIDVGDEVGTASYAAEFLTSSQVRSSLYPTIKFAEIDDVYTFGGGTVDIFSVAAGSAAQEGSSGGLVMSDNDRLIGLITTRTVKPDLSLRTLQALTPNHIRDSFRSDTGENLDSYLRQSIPVLIQEFQGMSIELKDILFEAIEDAQN